MSRRMLVVVFIAFLLSVKLLFVLVILTYFLVRYWRVTARPMVMKIVEKY